ncbi:hypothetical protein DASC09_008480 [Saccharomycopsis crataegensis]|uniref:Potassium transporter n=1 Tax=Saccharomycopsis crataegensis TaxID=43959 RepID=A0AAV5QH80_9ASCO|nr:hypothetical protein DASC09_008480 [Saccharomycopsis crataegensis]
MATENEHQDVESQQSFNKFSENLSSVNNSPKTGGYPWRTTIFLGFSSLGAIYGDIGTSPLYVYASIFPDGTPSRPDIIGACSCIFWLFFLIVIVKYCLIVLYFGPNNNEGGQIAIYAKIASHLSIGPKGVMINEEQKDLLTFTRSETLDRSGAATGKDSSSKRRKFRLLKDGRYNKTLVNKYLAKFIMGLCFLGCGLVISDGLLTPTTSVLSAVDGISVAAPSFSNKVLPVSCVILVILFLIQGAGSGKISLFFAPIILIWLILLFVCGVINIVKYDKAVFKALNPAEAIQFLQRQGDIDKFGAVILAITGTEAMFADIGHFSRFSIQLTLGFVVFPCLIIQYLGQAAYLLQSPESISMAFYLAIPGGTGGPLYWIVFVFATLATIIASQALILGVFSILKQLIHLDCFPNFRIVHTSSKHVGKIYIPTVNYILMIAVVLTCVGFKTSANVTSAYGLGVAMDFVVTTFLITICLLYVYKVNLILAVLFFLIFGSLEMCLVISGLRKVVHGAWFTLMVAVLMTSFITFWRWARSLKIDQEYKDRSKVQNILVSAWKNDTINAPDAVSGKQKITFQLDYDASRNASSEPPEGNISSKRSYDLSSEEEKKEEQCNFRRKESECDYIDPYYKIKYQDNSYDFLRYNAIGIMYTDIIHILNSSSTVPKLYEHLLSSFPACPRSFIFLSIRIASVPYITTEDHIVVQKIKAVKKAGLYRCVVKYGFMDKVRINDNTIQAILKMIELDNLDEENFGGKYKMVDNIEEGQEYVSMSLSKAESRGPMEDVRVLHVVEKSLITSKEFQKGLYGDDAWAMKKLLYQITSKLRKIVLEQIFVPINNLFGGVEKSLELGDNDQLIFVGSNVKI